MSNSKLLHSFLLFLFFISFASSSSFSFNNTHLCSPQQSLALILFKQSLFSIDDTIYDEECQDWVGSNYYPIMMNWNTSIDCCTWDGVTCNHFTGDVIGLDLSCGRLQGTIYPNSTLFHLPHLQRLNLAFNDFSLSSLPPEIGRFASSLTHLNISKCWFTGQIPSEIALLPNLVSLDLSWNLFDSWLKPHLFYSFLQNSTLLRELLLGGVDISLVLPTYLNINSSLKLLDLSFTRVQGKLPDNIFNLHNLEKLDLSGTLNLVGQLPKVNMSINIPLKWLGLSSTNLSGEIPSSIGHLKSLNHLDLSWSGLSGEIPSSIGHLESLNHLDLSGTGLSGEIPDSIGYLKSLNTLRLSKCRFMGPIPRSVVNLRHLTTLHLADNMLNETLPSGLFTLPSLEIIYLDNNMFSGSIPSELFTQQSLKELSLHGNQLVGKIDVLDQGLNPESFQQLINLTYLDLSYNNFTGEWKLDTLLSSLTNLEILHLSYSGLSIHNNATHYVNPNFRWLDLASCKLTVFPESLRAMRKLEYLDLSSNEIHGNVPDWAGEIGGNQLRYLNLSHNFITGLPQFQWDGLHSLYLRSNHIEGPFPQSICNMSELWDLDMSNNSFGGVIPQCLGNINMLNMVDLGNNCFHGTIPNVFEHHIQLLGLILNGNNLEGEVPSSLSECQNLTVLDLGNNHLNGTFPGWLEDLSLLQVLILRSNKFHGPIESSSMIELLFPSLRVLDLSKNGFEGCLPRKYFQNFKAMKSAVKKGPKLEYLRFGDKFYSVNFAVKGQQLPFRKFSVDYTIVDLSNNRFESEIPGIIGSLNSLIVLNLSHNSLTGRIPHSLGNLSEIESLDLSWNQLVGEIPQSLAAITSLEVINLSQNHLVGRIPEGKQFNTFEGNSFGGNPELCGFPLPKHCEHPSSPQLEADGDTESGFTWKVVMLGYGCGTVIGLVLGYIMLSTGKPKWFNAIYDAGEQMIQTRQNKRRYLYIGK